MIFILVTLTLLLGIFVLAKKLQNEHRNLPPGPWGLPLLGHLVSLGLNPHLTLVKWKQKYGPIIYCRFGSFPTVVLCNSKMIKEAYSMIEFAGRPKLQAYEDAGVSKGIGMSEGQYNTELRQFTLRKLKESFGTGRQSLEDQIHQGISEFMDFIKMRKGLPIKSEDVPSAHIIRTLWAFTMTDEMNPADAEQLNQRIKAINHIDSALSELAGFMPWLENITRAISFGQYSLTSARTHQVQEYFSFFTKQLQEREINRTKTGSDQLPVHTDADIDIMHLFLEKVRETTNESSPFHVSSKSATHFLGDIFSASIHTTHTALLWLFNYMARNPEAQLKLQEEIDQVIGNSRLPSLSDRGEMPYAEAVVYELLRMSSVLPLSLPHKTTSDVCFHGYTIKKDTMIFANLYGVHYDPEIWGDVDNFRPERWFGEAGKKLRNENFLPFSTGRRNCVGEALGREQLFLYVTTLFQQYNIDFYGKGVEVKAVFGTFLAPSKFIVVFNPRTKK